MTTQTPEALGSSNRAPSDQYRPNQSEATKYSARDSQPCSKMNLSLWKLHVQKVGFLSIQTPGIKGLPIGCIYRDYKDHTGVRFAKRHVLFIVRNVDL